MQFIVQQETSELHRVHPTVNTAQ